MAELFKKPKKKNKGFRHKPNNKVKEDIMDPVLYIGGLDKEKYPQLPLETENNPEEDIENPLNQRQSRL